MDNDTLPTLCLRQELVDGKFVTCPGAYEVRVPLYLERRYSPHPPKAGEDSGLHLPFLRLGDVDGAEAVVVNCNTCGKPAPRVFYACLTLALRDLTGKLKEALK